MSVKEPTIKILVENGLVENGYGIFYSLCLENGVTMTPKGRLLTLIFACLYYRNELDFVSSKKKKTKTYRASSKSQERILNTI